MLIVVNLTLGFWLLEFISVLLCCFYWMLKYRYTRSVCFLFFLYFFRNRDVQLLDTSLTRAKSSRKRARKVLISVGFGNEVLRGIDSKAVNFLVG